MIKEERVILTSAYTRDILRCSFCGRPKRPNGTTSKNSYAHGFSCTCCLGKATVPFSMRNVSSPKFTELARYIYRGDAKGFDVHLALALISKEVM